VKIRAVMVSRRRATLFWTDYVSPKANSEAAANQYSPRILVKQPPPVVVVVEDDDMLRAALGR
jgi:hypothetical protein